MRCAAVAIGVLAVVGLSACGEDAPPRTDLPYVLYCDIASDDCQRRIYDSVATMLGADGTDPPAIRTISVEQHADEVRSGLNLEDLTGEDAETRGLRLMAFIPEASDSVTETQAEYWINQIAAYYSRRNHAITVIDRDYEEVSAQALLAHEFTHAIQNVQFSLDAVGADADTEDGVMGVRGVIEGDATHSSFAWAYRELGYLPEEIDWDAIHDERTEGARKRAADPEVALIDSASSFPYSYGFDFMSAVTLSGGLDGRAAAFGAPPATAIEVMAGYNAVLGAFDFPEAAHPAPLEGHAVEVENRFGAWYVYGFLRRRGMSDHAAWMTSMSWLGDELAIYDDGNEVVATWRVRFDHALSASVLRDQVNADDRAVAWSAVLRDADVFVFAAETEEVLLAWAGQPLDVMTASLIPKTARRRGGAVSAGNCLQSRRFSLPNPPPLLH
ncbi:MAG: hypothetical protein DRH23_05840 [Deltaproteobacteria bacterium]|nr:MAG: hypothetical protein DRH23_05840 [Deltaproteobacteria bacterium]